jgi:NADPH:quinone reductase-like Zn-dependent oxidoreductase
VVQSAANSALGKMLIRLCRQEGVSLINIVRSAKSAEAIRAEGADNVLDSSDANFLTDYKAACTRLNATIAFDAVAGDMTGTVLSGLCPGGVVYVFGALSHQPSNGIQASDIIFQGKRVEGLGTVFWLAKKTNEEKQQLYSEIQQSISTIFRTDFIGHFPLSRVQEALGSYKANLSAGKVLLHPSQR